MDGSRSTKIEICMISARGLPRSSSFWKLHWFAVGWIDPDKKYCSKMDTSGSSSPTWRTKFAADLDGAELDPQSLSLTVEVRSRDAVFLREKLHGSVVIPLKEFLAKFSSFEDVGTAGLEEVGSFQLRGRNSGRPRGFVDVSVRILDDQGARSGISLAVEDGQEIVYPTAPRRHRRHNAGSQEDDPSHAPGRPGLGGRYRESSPGWDPGEGYADEQTTSPPTATNHPNYGAWSTGHRARPRPPPPPPPPPSNTGFISSFFPSTGQLPPTATSSGPPIARAGFGAGALAAGAVIFGDDYMSTSSFGGGSNLEVSTDSPF